MFYFLNYIFKNALFIDSFSFIIYWSSQIDRWSNEKYRDQEEKNINRYINPNFPIETLPKHLNTQENKKETLLKQQSEIIIKTVEHPLLIPAKYL